MIKIDDSNENYTIASFEATVKKFDILLAENARKKLQMVIDGGKPYLILDLKGILYLDSSGFGTIISLSNYSKNSGVHFILCNLSPTILELIKITKLTGVLTVFSDLKDAIGSIKKNNLIS